MPWLNVSARVAMAEYVSNKLYDVTRHLYTYNRVLQNETGI